MLYPGIPSPTTPYIQPMYIPMSSPNPRKRPAPGNLPTPTPVTPQPQSQQAYFPPTATADHMAGWNGNNAATGFMEDASNSINNYGIMPATTQTQFRPNVAAVAPPSAAPSTALARRGANNQLVTTNRSFNSQPNDQWSGFGDDSLMTQQNGGPRVDEHDNIEVLEERAQRAKREAQAKRKQIPPFVQKLNSFLEESKNTDLIRWSEKGDSFIVLDEDEFAKTLIPELFKHNNYASFVRQLNMYGFHKKVGLSDNSMKASERKNKSPSEYYNPYFRRGHPNLLWLINKPKGGTSKKKTKRSEDAEVESDEDGAVEEAVAQTFNTAPAPVPNRALPAPEPGPLQKKELAVVRDQVQNLQHQHQAIAMQISRLQNEHRQLAGQAKIFQEQHDRHEHSINAILTFLANVFRKPLEEQGVVNNMNDLFAGIIPNLQMPQGQQQGNVVDLSDWDHQQQSMPAAMATPSKRSQRLLMPVPGAAAAQLKRSASASPSYSGPHQPPMGTITELLDHSPDPMPGTPYLKQDLQSNAQEGMMRMMQDVNTNAGSKASGVDLPDLGGNGTTPMTDDQRNRMLSIMTASQGGDGSSPTSGQSNMFPHQAVTSPGPSAVPPSFSPMLRSPVPPPSLQAMSRTQAEIEQLQKLQKEQNDQIDHLNSLLKPLSPSGEIPGLDGYFDDNVDNFEPVDFGNFIDPNAFNGDGTTGDFDFGAANFEAGNFDLLNDSYTANNNYQAVSNAGSRVETETPSNKSLSPAATEEVPRDDLEESPGRAAKRQRKG